MGTGMLGMRARVMSGGNVERKRGKYEAARVLACEYYKLLLVKVKLGNKWNTPNKFPFNVKYQSGKGYVVQTIYMNEYSIKLSIWQIIK